MESDEQPESGPSSIFGGVTRVIRSHRDAPGQLNRLAAIAGVIAVAVVATIVWQRMSPADPAASPTAYATTAGAEADLLADDLTATPSGTPSASGSATPSTTASPSKAVSPSPAKASGWACALPAYPRPSCTGAPAGAQLTTRSGDVVVTTAGQVIDRLHVTGQIVVKASGVVVRDSEADGGIVTDGGSVSVTDTTIGPSSGCGFAGLHGGNVTAVRVRVRGSSQPFRVDGGNTVIRDSYAASCGDDTADGVDSYCPDGPCGNVVLTHNTFDTRAAAANGAVFLDNTNLRSVTIQNNLFAGGGYTVFLGYTAGPAWKVTGNKIVSGSWTYGPVYATGLCAGSAWSGNSLVKIDDSYQVTATVSTAACFPS
ncbi:right-handed parallel beta-helix repeat-containing protein [Hamadaea sp. NPDC051192]|uniref:right-handed parallel beta-helix repeat-containing protein n=1 Tax=Hamadaea sp. NPDC051192 TaxID=3154940 RepID=UPI003415A8C8